MTSSRRSRLASAARSRSSASWRRECRPLIPAASSSRERRSTGLALMMAPMRPWLTRAVECAPVAASAKSSWTSRARTCEPLMRKSEPSPRSMRRMISISGPAAKGSGISCPALSTSSATSARLRAGRVEVPPKMMSSISPPRMRFAEFSPITQRSASTRFDLPQPFGPTIPVMPGSIDNSVRSTKDLNPVRLSRVNCKDRYRAGWMGCGLTSAASRLRRGRFERLEDLFRSGPDHLLAIDEEGRCRFDAELLFGGETAGDDLVLQSVVLEAGPELLLAHAAKLGEPAEAGHRVGGDSPRLLLGEEHVDEAVEAFGRRAARDERRLERRGVEREIAEDQLGLAGIDPVGLDLRQDFLFEGGAMRAGQRGVFEDRDRRVGL